MILYSYLSMFLDSYLSNFFIRNAFVFLWSILCKCFVLMYFFKLHLWQYSESTLYIANIYIYAANIPLLLVIYSKNIPPAKHFYLKLLILLFILLFIYSHILFNIIYSYLLCIIFYILYSKNIPPAKLFCLKLLIWYSLFIYSQILFIISYSYILLFIIILYILKNIPPYKLLFHSEKRMCLVSNQVLFKKISGSDWVGRLNLKFNHCTPIPPLDLVKSNQFECNWISPLL